MFKILGFLILTLTLFFFIQSYSLVAAHLGIMYISQISVNSLPEVENSIIDFTTPHKLKLAISKLEKPFIVGESLTFEANDTAGSANKKEIMYQWNFNDETEMKEGNRVNHVFKNQGTYNLELKKGLKNNRAMQLVDTLKIDIIPYPGYPLPHADFTANGKSIIKGYINFIELNNTKILFKASDSASMNNIKKYIWDFSDNQYAEGKTVEYRYKGKNNSVTAILRVIDGNNIIDETYSIIAFKNLEQTLGEKQHTVKNTNSVMNVFQNIMNFFHFRSN